MSGRTLHLRDGQWITNRKTDRRQSKPHDQEWILAFDLPLSLGDLVLHSFRPGMTGITIGARSHIEIKGNSKALLLQRAVDFLREVAMYGLGEKTIDLQFSRVGAPPQPYSRARKFQIRWNGQHPTLIYGGVMRPLSDRR